MAKFEAKSIDSMTFSMEKKRTKIHILPGCYEKNEIGQHMLYPYSQRCDSRNYYGSNFGFDSGSSGRLVTTNVDPWLLAENSSLLSNIFN